MSISRTGWVVLYVLMLAFAAFFIWAGYDSQTGHVCGIPHAQLPHPERIGDDLFILMAIVFYLMAAVMLVLPVGFLPECERRHYRSS